MSESDCLIRVSAPFDPPATPVVPDFSGLQPIDQPIAAMKVVSVILPAPGKMIRVWLPAKSCIASPGLQNDQPCLIILVPTNVGMPSIAIDLQVSKVGDVVPPGMSVFAAPIIINGCSLVVLLRSLP